MITAARPAPPVAHRLAAAMVGAAFEVDVEVALALASAGEADVVAGAVVVGAEVDTAATAAKSEL